MMGKPRWNFENEIRKYAFPAFFCMVQCLLWFLPIKIDGINEEVLYKHSYIVIESKQIKKP